jgi:TonB family protein
VRPTFISEVSLEPSQPGILRRGIHHVPVLNLFGRHNYKSGSDFAPARPVREVRPRLPEDAQQEGPQHPDVDIKVWIDDTGQVTKAELLSDHVDPEIADVASNAACKWTFEPARLSDRPVSSEMVMHFRFVPKQSY